MARSDMQFWLTGILADRATKGLYHDPSQAELLSEKKQGVTFLMVVIISSRFDKACRVSKQLACQCRIAKYISRFSRWTLRWISQGKSDRPAQAMSVYSERKTMCWLKASVAALTCNEVTLDPGRNLKIRAIKMHACCKRQTLVAEPYADARDVS